jgi:hypothetical protein
MWQGEGLPSSHRQDRREKYENVDLTSQRRSSVSTGGLFICPLTTASRCQMVSDLGTRIQMISSPRRWAASVPRGWNDILSFSIRADDLVNLKSAPPISRLSESHTMTFGPKLKGLARHREVFVDSMVIAGRRRTMSRLLRSSLPRSGSLCLGRIRGHAAWSPCTQ